MAQNTESEYDTPFVKLMEKRFHDVAYPKDGSECSYETMGEYLGVLNFPRGYGVEDEMLAYAQEHEDATMAELLKYFDTLSFGRDPVEDLDEDDEWGDDNGFTLTEFGQKLLGSLSLQLDFMNDEITNEAVAFTAACEEKGIEDKALAFVRGHKKLTVKDLWNFLAKFEED